MLRARMVPGSDSKRGSGVAFGAMCGDRKIEQDSAMATAVALGGTEAGEGAWGEVRQLWHVPMELGEAFKVEKARGGAG